MVDNSVIKRPSSSSKPKSRRREEGEDYNIYVLDKAYNSKPEEQELIKRGYVLHITPKEREVKRGGGQDGNITYP